jgi:hypothetical protein
LALAISLSAVFGATGTHAAIYRCGNTYSNVPCDNAKTVQEPAATNSNDASDNRAANDHVCVKSLHTFVQFTDPESVRVVSISPTGTAAEFEVAGTKVIALRYSMSINAKNEYGGYVGARAFSCYVSRASGQVLGIRD